MYARAGGQVCHHWFIAMREPSDAAIRKAESRTVRESRYNPGFSLCLEVNTAQRAPELTHSTGS